jgi:isoquinoline 1-oxidoreductase alpha subunit
LAISDAFLCQRPKLGAWTVRLKPCYHRQYSPAAGKFAATLSLRAQGTYPTFSEQTRMMSLNVNGVRHDIQSPDDTPLLYVLRDELGLNGPQFGCGMAQCGACAVLVDGKETRSCITALSDVSSQQIITIEGLPARWAKHKGIAEDQAGQVLHPVQQAWIEQQTPQCGFCQNGMMIKATELLESNPHPTVAEIKDAYTNGISPMLCRCGTYTAIIEAVQNAATIMARG